VHHGLPLDLHSFRAKPGEYLAFLGRISREKRVDRAIEIARRTGMTLKIAAKIDRADRDYYEKEVRHLFDDPCVEFVGEVGGSAKDEFLGQAKALLFPIDWPEPFGLVMIEALACGTPVIAWPCGSVPEVIEPGVTGFLVNSVEDAVQAVENLPSLSRRRCRERFEERFSVERMTRDYVALYEKLLAGGRAERKTSRTFVPAPVRPPGGRRAASAEIAARINGGFAEPRQGLAASS
jgi:glycosyltransferase involved in cell wall biosynthesis